MYHRDILELGKKLGFSDQGGLCHGFTIRWIEAQLLSAEDIEKFFKRISIIHNLNFLSKEALEQAIASVKQKIKLQGQSALNEEESSLLNVIAFYDSMYLFQSPDEHSQVLEGIVSQKKITTVSQLASADKILDQGGLVELSSQIGFYKRQDIIQLLQSYAKVEPEKTIGFYLNNKRHAIGLSYHPQQGWFFVDINQNDLFDSHQSQGFKGMTPLALTEICARILTGFQTDYEQTVCFNISPITTDHQARTYQFPQRFNALSQGKSLNKKIHISIEEWKKSINTIIYKDALELLDEMVKQGYPLENIEAHLEYAITNESPKMAKYFAKKTSISFELFIKLISSRKQILLELQESTFLETLQKNKDILSLIEDHKILQIIENLHDQPSYLVPILKELSKIDDFATKMSAFFMQLIEKNNILVCKNLMACLSTDDIITYEELCNLFLNSLSQEQLQAILPGLAIKLKSIPYDKL